MSDTYQPVFDAVRSALRNTDVGAAVREAFSGCDFSWLRARAGEAITSTENEYQRPAVLFHPTLTLDGNAWIAVYGSNLQEGVVGTGDSPCEAMADFDRAWYAKINGGGEHGD